MVISKEKKYVSRRKKAITWTACCIAAAALLVFAPTLAVVSAFVSTHVDYSGVASEKYPLQAVYSAKDFGLESRELYLEAADGTKVFVSEVAAEQPRGIVIILTGIRQPSVTYFYPQAGWLRENGFSSFLLETRGHGESGGRVSLGIAEPMDVRAAVDYIRSLPNYEGLPITVMGVSMGGAAAATSFGSIAEIDGLIAMSAYSSFEEQVSDLMRHYYAPALLCDAAKFSTRLWLSAYFGDDTYNMTPVKQLESADGRPVLLIAAAGDSTVSAENTVRLAAAAQGNAEIWIRNSQDHFIIKGCDFLNFRDDEEYCEHILAFLERVI